MFKALLKKQFLEVNQSFFINKKTNEKKKKGATIRSIILFVVLMVFVGAMFYILSGSLSSLLLTETSGTTDWFFFAIEGILSIILGVFGSVFNTMSMLYKAKDNELLLSMPIPPLYILISRMIMVYAMSLLYTAPIWVAAMIRYQNSRGWNIGTLLLELFLLLMLALLVTVLACVAGWVVAMISGKLRNRSIVTVLISLVCFGVYYFICFRLNTILTTIAAQSEEIGGKIKLWAYPIYELGQGAAGKVSAAFIFAAITIVLFAICCFVLSRSFIKIITQNKGLKKAVYKEKTTAQRSVKQALFRRELVHYTKSSTYMLNCTLGMVLLLAAGIVALIYRSKIQSVLGSFIGDSPEVWSFIYVVLAAVICLALSMNLVTAPSVSLEGKSIWLAQSLPVKTIDILHAKEKLHLAVNLVPALVSTLMIGIAFGVDPVFMIILLALVVAHTFFTAAFGLRLNLKHPNLNWTNEAMPIKQSMSVMVGMFGGWAICIIPAVLYYFVWAIMPAKIYVLICIVLLLIATLLIEKWLKGRGARIFEEL